MKGNLRFHATMSVGSNPVFYSLSPYTLVSRLRSHHDLTLRSARSAPRSVDFQLASPDNRECAKSVSWISCRDIRHSSYASVPNIFCRELPSALRGSIPVQVHGGFAAVWLPFVNHPWKSAK